MKKRPTLEELNSIMEKTGGWLDLSGTQITSLPDNLTVGGSLYLSGTQITSLPDNLTVGGSLDLRGTQITSLPDNLTVGGSLYLSGTQITNPNAYKRLKNGVYVPGRFLYADGILTHVKRVKKVGTYKFYVGKIEGNNVLYDGKYYAHCRTIKEGIDDLAFKSLKDRGADQYKSVNLDDTVTREQAVAMYRIITGACHAGTENFISNLSEVKDEYTVREIIELTKGHYGSNAFRRFFEGE